MPAFLNWLHPTVTVHCSVHCATLHKTKDTRAGLEGSAQNLNPQVDLIIYFVSNKLQTKYVNRMEYLL